MRLYIPFILFAAAIVWILYTWLVKKNAKGAVAILKPTLFFGAVWGIIYYLIFS